MNQSPTRYKIYLAFASVYLIWGSTYLAIALAIKTMPPFLMAGVRFVFAGALLYGFLRARGPVKTTAKEWLSCGITGTFMLLGGNGGVVWAEQYVPSGLAALLISLLPIWVLLLSPLFGLPRNVTRLKIFGIILGFAGLVLLINPGSIFHSDSLNIPGSIALICATLFWAIGSLYTRKGSFPANKLLSTAMQMITGGTALLIFSGFYGDFAHFNPSAVTTEAVLAFFYLVFFGSIIGYTSYVWLLEHTEPQKVVTYAYVNPVVAVFLGWALNNEPLTGTILLAAVVIIGAVVLILTGNKKPA